MIDPNKILILNPDIDHQELVDAITLRINSVSKMASSLIHYDQDSNMAGTGDVMARQAG